MNSFRYQAIGSNGAPAHGVIEAEDRRAALRLLGQRGLFPSSLEVCGANGKASAAPSHAPAAGFASESSANTGGRVKRKDVTAFTREMGALLGAGIPIPQALDGLGEEEENPAMRAVVTGIATSVRKGISLSAALEEHPKLFSNLYVSMVKVGEEGGVLPKVMADLAELLEHEDEVRGEVVSAVAYPFFVLGFGIVTVIILLTVVLPKVIGMLKDMTQVLPLPTLILLGTSAFFHKYWPLLLIGGIGAGFGIWKYSKTPAGHEMLDRLKLKLPFVGGVFRSSALSRFARTLGTLVRSGVSLLPALKIVEQTIGNVVLAKVVAQVAEETRGGDSLATPLRRLISKISSGSSEPSMWMCSSALGMRASSWGRRSAGMGGTWETMREA